MDEARPEASREQLAAERRVKILEEVLRKVQPTLAQLARGLARYAPAEEDPKYVDSEHAKIIELLLLLDETSSGRTIGFEERTRNAERDLKGAIEVIARDIVWRRWIEQETIGQPRLKQSIPNWVEWGNSLKQDEARAEADKLIQLARRAS